MYWYDYNRPIRKIPVRRARQASNVPAQANGQAGAVNEITPEPSQPVQDEVTSPEANEMDWKTRALRLQADMDNFRKRQVRRADEAIAAERERLLRSLLPVADNLNRALNHNNQEDVALRQGVELIYRELMRLLEAEGVVPFEAAGQPFDPNLHEAVATVPAGAESGTIVEELEKGYKRDDKLLRPARVVVAA